MREIRTLRAMRRGLETAHGSDIEALPTETGSNKLGRAYGAMAPVLDPTKTAASLPFPGWILPPGWDENRVIGGAALVLLFIGLSRK